MKIDNIGQAIILCGGKGSRLNEITDNKLNKVVIKIGKYPFIYYILYQLEKLGIKKIVLCTGYLSDSIKEVIDNFEIKNKNKFQFIFSTETNQLGTAGALINSKKFIENKYSLVLNGDTFFCGNISNFLNHSFKNNISILTSLKFFNNSYGKVKINKNNYLINFQEKKFNLIGYVYAGISLFDNQLLNQKNINNSINIEDYYFRNNNYKIYVYKTLNNFIDIGTVLRFKKNKNFFNSIELPYY